MKELILKNMVPLFFLFCFSSASNGIESLANDQELNKSLIHLLEILPTHVSKNLQGKILVRTIKSHNSKLDLLKMSTDEIVHKLTSVQKWHNKWIINVDEHAKSLAGCLTSSCNLDLDHLLLHNIAHVYDDLKILFPVNKAEIQIFKYCAEAYHFARNSIPQPCQIIGRIQKSISDHQDFRDLVYLDANPYEAFASKFSDYVLNSDFACRQPTLARYFSLRVGPVIKSDGHSCQTSHLIPYMSVSDDETYPINLDPSRIYRVDYLLVSEGEDIESSLGHTMFRLVVCAPERSEVSESCVKDTAYHIGVGFAAYQGLNGDDLLGLKAKLNGLFGGYPSVIDVRPLSEIVKQYNIGEDRALKAYPLKLSKSEVENFVLQTINSYWNHNKDYYFLNNNCATEGFGLIKRSLNRPYNRLFNSKVKILSPKLLLKHLQEANLINYKTSEKKEDKRFAERIYEPDPIKDRYVNYFPSKAEITMKDFAENEKKFWYFSPRKLKSSFDRLAVTREEEYRYASSFRIIEKNRITRLQQKFATWIQQQLAQSTDAELKKQSLEFETSFLDLMKQLRLRRPLNETITSATGIPSNSEISVALMQLQMAQKDLHQKYNQLNERIKDGESGIDEHFKEAQELKDAEKNLAFYDKVVIDYLSRKASK